MKTQNILFSILGLLTFTNLFSQQHNTNDTSFKDLIRIADNRYVIKHRGEDGFFFTAEIEMKKDNRHYIRNGFCVEFYDSSFLHIRRKGYYLNDNETGMWQEFDSSGLLSLEGLCKLVMYKPFFTKKMNKILRIDSENPMDTIYLDYTKKVMDSLQKSISYYDTFYYHGFPTDTSGYGMILPSHHSLKIGEWKYYNSGKLRRKEFYIEGVMIRSFNY